jgi:hypothetical protein
MLNLFGGQIRNKHFVLQELVDLGRCFAKLFARASLDDHLLVHDALAIITIL